MRSAEHPLGTGADILWPRLVPRRVAVGPDVVLELKARRGITERPNVMNMPLEFSLLFNFHCVITRKFSLFCRLGKFADKPLNLHYEHCGLWSSSGWNRRICLYFPAKQGIDALRGVR
jgi:hypothetical protein